MKRAVIILIMVFLLCSPVKAGQIYLNFNQVDINDFIKFVVKEFKKNVVYDGSLRGKITIISYKPVDKDTFWKIFSEAISLVGGIVYKEKGYIKITNARNIRNTTPSIENQPPAYQGEPYVLIYNLKHLNPGKIVRVIIPLLSNRAFVNFIQGTSLMIIRDYGENLKRIKSFLELIDREASGYKLEIFTLKYASAFDVYREILPIIQEAASFRGIPFKLSKDDRTNSIIVYATQDIIDLVSKTIKRLDVPIKPLGRRFYIIPIKFASAENIVKVLRTLNLSKVMQFVHSKDKIKEIPFSITADKNTNTVVVYATPEEYQKIKRLIEDLDIERKQVLLATTVVEVSWSKIRDLGIHWQAIGKFGGATFGGLSNADIFNAIHQGNLVAGVFSPSGENISIGGVNVFFPDLLFLFSLLQQESSFRILSNPKILTLDNQKAEIKVGESVPYTTGITYQTNSLPTVSFDYRDVGLDLTITPHICGDSVKLEVKQTLQEVTQVYRAMQGTIDFVAPVTSKREITSQIIVKNGQTVILGGLISRKNKTQFSHVPWLSSIPLLGWLFKRKNVEDQKTTLFVFITPYIISSPDQLKKITQEHELLARDLKAWLKFKQREAK